MTSNIKILAMKDPINKFKIKKKFIGDLPMRAVILGNSGSGKTSLLALMVIDPLDQFYGKDFEGDNIYIFSGSLKTDSKIENLIKVKDVPPENVFDDYYDEELGLIYDLIEDNVKEAKEEGERPPHSLIILDDLTFNSKVSAKRNNNIKRVYLNGRKNLISIICVSQSYTTGLQPAIRENTNLLICYNMSQRQLERVENDHNYLDSKRAFFNMFRDNVEEKHDFLVINHTNKFKDLYLDKDFNIIDTTKYTLKAPKKEKKKLTDNIDESGKV